MPRAAHRACASGAASAKRRLEPVDLAVEVVEPRLDLLDLRQLVRCLDASCSFVARATKVDVIAAVRMAKNAIPSSITKVAMIAAGGVGGGDVAVADGGDRLDRPPHPDPDVGVLLVVEHPIRTPLMTTTPAVAKTIVAAAPRTVGGSRRNLPIRFSMQLVRAIAMDVTAACRQPGPAETPVPERRSPSTE